MTIEIENKSKNQVQRYITFEFIFVLYRTESNLKKCMAQSIENMKTCGSLEFDADDGYGRPCSFNPLLQRSVWQ